MRKEYPSDISRGQFEVVRYLLESAKKETHPMRYDLYDIFCAALYVLKEGCTRRALPHDYPPWQGVCYHFKTWKGHKSDKISVLEKVLAELVVSGRVINGRDPKTSMIIVDSKSVRNTDTAEEKGYDGGGEKYPGPSCTLGWTQTACPMQWPSPRRTSRTATAPWGDFYALMLRRQVRWVSGGGEQLSPQFLDGLDFSFLQAPY